MWTRPSLRGQDEHRDGGAYSGQRRQRLPAFRPAGQGDKENSAINEVSADKAYSSDENFKMVADCCGTGYMAFKSSATGGIAACAGRYSTIDLSAIKRKFGIACEAGRKKTW
jgi:hypothetical protein